MTEGWNCEKERESEGSVRERVSENRKDELLKTEKKKGIKKEMKVGRKGTGEERRECESGRCKRGRMDETGRDRERDEGRGGQARTLTRRDIKSERG